jgi:hypothetical protein
MDDGAYVDSTFGSTDKAPLDNDGTVLSAREQELHEGWDATVWRYTPHSLKGLKPVTDEPWAHDEAVYNGSRNSVDRRESSEHTPPSHFNFRKSSESGPQWDTSRREERTGWYALPGRAYPA